MIGLCLYIWRGRPGAKCHFHNLTGEGQISAWSLWMQPVDTCRSAFVCFLLESCPSAPSIYALEMELAHTSRTGGAELCSRACVRVSLTRLRQRLTHAPASGFFFTSRRSFRPHCRCSRIGSSPHRLRLVGSKGVKDIYFILLVRI